MLCGGVGGHASLFHLRDHRGPGRADPLLLWFIHYFWRPFCKGHLPPLQLVCNLLGVILVTLKNLEPKSGRRWIEGASAFGSSMAIVALRLSRRIRSERANGRYFTSLGSETPRSVS
jgi:hypothetical protein